MRIQHNITAMNSYRNFSANNSSLSKNLEKLSSGYKINRAGDDAAGLAISEKMRAQITGLEGATKNAKDGISLIQTAEGALTEVHSMLNRMVTLTEQSANGTYDNDVDRKQLQKEVDALKTEIDRVADSTNFNGLKLLDGSLSGTKPDQVSEITGNIEGMSLDATKAKSEIALKDLDLANLSNDNTALDGTSVSLNLSLSDGSGKELKLNFVKKDANTVEIQDNEGKVLNTFAKTATAAAVKSAITDSFRKEIKNDEVLGKAFSASISTASDKALVLEAKTAGSEGLTVKAADLTASKGTNTSTAAGLANDAKVGEIFNASNMTNAAAANTAIMPKVTEGKDAVTAFKASDITLYNDNYVDEKDGHLGNADRAVFEINGHKFAIGTSNQRPKNLDADVNFISVKAGSTAGTTEANMTSSGLGAVLTEEIGKANVGKSSDGQATAQSRKLNADAMAQIASEIERVAGVKVDFNNTDYKVADNNGKNGATFDDGEKLTDTGRTGGQAVAVFTVGKQIGKDGKSLTLQIGDTSDEFNKMSVQVADMHVEALGLKDIDISTQEGASEALSKIKDAVNQVSDTRGGLGALQNRLDHTINNLGVMRENIQNAESAIRDTDVAEEMMTYTKNSILNQSAQAMLAQANQLPQGVLQLLG